MKQILLCAVMVLLSAANAVAQDNGAELRPDFDLRRDHPLPDKFADRHNPVELKARKVIRRAEADESNQFTDDQGIIYELDEGGEAYSVIGYTDELKSEIEIASEVNGLPVTSVGRMAFYYNYSLTSVTIPEGITTLEYGAFASCSNLSNISIPSSVTFIGDYAFYYCSALTSVVIPDGVTSIAYAAFYRCRSLTSVVIPNSVTSIGDYAFEYCVHLTSITIPENVTSIGEEAFYNCIGLTSINIPESVTSIGDYAFCECSGLASVIIPESVTSIGLGMFQGCSGLTSVTISADITSIGNRAFMNCSSLNSFTIPESVTTIGNDAFAGCEGLTSITIPESVTTIGNDAFAGCEGLTSITIPESVTTIGDYAFCRSGLTSLVIPKSVLSIGESAFARCSGLTSIVVESDNSAYDSRNNCNAIIETSSNKLIAGCNTTTIPNGVASIGINAFAMCSSITTITIPKSVTTISDYAFWYCPDLTTITIPENVISIAYNAFSGCRGLTSIVVESGNSVYDSRNNCNAIIETATNTLISGCNNTTIPNDVDSIGNYAFYGISSLTSITIPESVTTISDYAFAYCTGLTSITIPKSVTSIGNDAFRNCYDLASVTMLEGVKSIGDDVFYYCSALTSITIPESLTSIGDNTFGFCSALTSITIPKSVTSIGKYAFQNCIGLYSIILPEGLTSLGAYAFDGCRALTSVTIPKSLTELLSGYMFSGCTALTSIRVFYKEPIAINYQFFENLYETATLYVPYGSKQAYAEAEDWNMFTNIEEMAVTDDQGIIYGLDGDTQTYIVVGHTENLKSDIVIASEFEGMPVTRIASYAFSGCKGLTSVSIPASVTSIDYYAFAGCEGLKKAEFASIESLCNIAFEYDSNPLQYAHHLYINGEEITGNIVIPSTVTEIGRGAFYGCTEITSVTIPESVTFIDYDAFRHCKLRNVYVKSATPISIYDEADDVFSDETCFHGILYVPAGSWDAYAFDENWYEFINIREVTTEQQEVKADVAYTLMDARTFQYAVYDQVNNRVRMVKSVNVDESDPNHCWQTITSGGKQYLYNIGARKFVVAATDGSSFTLTDKAGSLTIEDGTDGLVLNGHTETQWALVGNERIAADLSLVDIVTSVNGVTTSTPSILNVYDAGGRQQTTPRRGLNIVRKADGSATKLLVK